MAKAITPSDGDRIDLGGKLPQFDAFAFFVYNELVHNNLEWIKVADNEALKLDDIQYSTKSEIHAFQVKWSSLAKPEPFSYTDFKNIVPDIFAGWKALKTKHAGSLKKLKVHLLSNRPPSKDDNIKDGQNKIGTFKDFLQDVFWKIKSKAPISAVWQNCFQEFKALTAFQGNEFDEFVESFEINLDFNPEEFGIRVNNSAKNSHLTLLSRFLFESVVDKQKRIDYTATEIINAMGWEGHFVTIFNHSLVIDLDRYQPISATTSILDSLAYQHSSGYVFLLGGPGTGKSTLLTEWSKNRKERIIRYYAFDFTTPSAMNNNADRGEAVTFFYDLVSQLKTHGIYKENSLVEKDISFLRKAFERQLQELSEQFKQHGQKTILLVDGLDHVPRYTGVQRPFLADLLLPKEIPDGVIIILGSQSFELDALPAEIKIAWNAQDRSVVMAALTKEDISRYADKISTVTLTTEEKDNLYIISQGHPLYLSYVVNKINQDGEYLHDSEFLPIDGDIDIYYEKFWAQLETVQGLKNLLGLSARIRGPISLEFIIEWSISDDVLTAFRQKAFFLFYKTSNTLSFFHNSFRQFLLFKTANSPLTGEFEKRRDQDFHTALAGYYEKSTIEHSWNALYHLYYAGNFDKFLELAKPAVFTEQLLEFRPEQEIQSDIKTGILLGKQTGNPYIILRYLLSLNEFESRSRHMTVSSFTEEFIRLGDIGQAKKLLRNNAQLLVNKNFALDAAGWLYDVGELQEAKLIFTLATLEEVTKKGIQLKNVEIDLHRTVETIEKWVSIAALFENATTLYTICSGISTKDGKPLTPIKIKNIANNLLHAAARTYTDQQNWDELQKLLDLWISKDLFNESYYRSILISAASESIFQGDHSRASAYLKILKDNKGKWNYSDYSKLLIAELIYTLIGDVDAVKDWIKDIPQPATKTKKNASVDLTINDFSERILLNRLLTMTEQEPNILTTVPNANNEDDQLQVEFERMLILISKIHAQGMLKKSAEDVWRKSIPIIRFYYRIPTKHNTTWYDIQKMQKDYLNLLLYAVSRWGKEVLSSFIDSLILEFKAYPSFWKADQKRAILVELSNFGKANEKIRVELSTLEDEMVNGHDTSARVEECFLQGKAWNLLGEKDKAIHWFKESLRESFSIGYRKDYQFNRWLNWLRKVNPIQQNKAAKRLSIFISFLPHLKETVEGSSFYSAAKEVLSVRFEMDFAKGIQQFTWQIENGLIEFEDGLILTLNAMIKKATMVNELELVSLIYQKLLLYIAKDETNNLVQEILSKWFNLLKKDGFIIKADQLIQAVRTNSLEHTRTDILDTIRDFLVGKGIDTSTMGKSTAGARKENTSSNELVLSPDYRHISQEEAFAKVNSYEDFKKLFHSEDKANSFFSWAKIFEKINPMLTLENIRDFLDSKPSARKQSELFSLLSQRSFELNDEVLARELAEASLDHSSSSGWSAFYDGGTRLHAIKAFQKINKEESKRKALVTLTEDILNTTDWDSLLASWEEICALLTENPDPIQIWQEIEGYLGRLFGSATLPEIPEFIYQDDKQVVLTLLFHLANFPVKAINTPVKTILADIVIQDVSSRNIIESLVDKSEANTILLSEVLLLISGKENGEVFQFESVLKKMAISKNLEIRTNARKTMLAYYSIEEIPNAEPTELSPGFTLELPHDRKFRNMKKTEPFENIEDTDDPYKLITPYQNWLSLIEDETEIPRENIIQKWYELIIKKNDQQKLTGAYEREFQLLLKKLSIDFPFQRPRYAAVKTGLDYLLAELIDAGVFDPEIIGSYTSIDPLLESKVNIHERPQFVIPLSESKSRFLGEGWADQIHKTKRAAEGLLVYGDNVVIGENSYVKQLVWGRPSETYSTSCQFENRDTGNYNVYDCYYEDYYELMNISNTVLTISNTSSFDFHLGLMSKWIAFNPKIAISLNWRSSEKGNFAWENTEGDLMAYSVYWRSGNIYMSSHDKESEAAEGWYVILTQKGKGKIKGLNNQFILKKEVERNWFYEREKSNQLNIEIQITL
jgi:hypothetical protein